MRISEHRVKCSLSETAPEQVKVALLAVGVGKGRLDRDALVAELDQRLGGRLLAAARDEAFDGAEGDVIKVPTLGEIGARWIALAGLGRHCEEPHATRLTAMLGAHAARRHESLAIAAPADPSSIAAAVEGIYRGAYRHDVYRTKNEKERLGHAVVLTSAHRRVLGRALREGAIVGEAVTLARDLVNAPPNELTPDALAHQARVACKAAGVECHVWKEPQIARQNMHLLLAVGRGSAHPPRWVHATYRPPRAVARVVLVGKGLTFDSGGLCIKAPAGMATMKCDMAGAATVLGITIAAARMKLPIEVHGLIAAAENMTGPAAFRPGDVLASRDGRSIEIVNTDAEGRLVLADALSYARALEPDYLIDYATLTGACMVALGRKRAGLFANDAELGRRYAEAAEQAGESFWPLPLDEDLRPKLESEIADLKHMGDAYGGAVTAALFLREFVGETPWAHCDIAGPAFSEESSPFTAKGGTGFGVASGIRFLQALAAS